MTIQDFITKAIEGGWKDLRCIKHWNGYWAYCSTKTPHKYVDPVTDEEVDGFVSASFHAGDIFLDPEAWKAVGKVLGWSQSHRHYENNERKSGSRWRYEMHRMIDALAEGKSIEDFLATLLIEVHCDGSCANPTHSTEPSYHQRFRERFPYGMVSGANLGESATDDILAFMDEVAKAEYERGRLEEGEMCNYDIGYDDGVRDSRTALIEKEVKWPIMPGPKTPPLPKYNKEFS